jgi:asparagine synthase (glutamine-hydrolysing)
MQASKIFLEDLFDESHFERVSSEISRLDSVSKDAINTESSEKSVLAYSGGIDSAICARLLSGVRGVSLLSLGLSGSRDVSDLRHNRDSTLLVELERERVEHAALKVARLMKHGNISHFEDCVAFYLIGEEARKLGAGKVISANGPDEVYCGYDRFRRLIDDQGEEAVCSEIRRALVIAEDLSKMVKSILSTLGMGCEEPFLKKEFTSFALGLPVALKLRAGNDRLRKRIWRAYGRSLGLPERTVLKEKKAMQYSMGIHKIVGPMVKRGTIALERN